MSTKNKKDVDNVSNATYNVSIDNRCGHIEYMKGGKNMEITLQAEREKRETIEFVELLKTMSKEEKHELRGIMLGINLAKKTAKTA